MKNQLKALKVKIKSLAAEARIIRLEEKKALCHHVRPGKGDTLKEKKWWKELREKFADMTEYLSLRNHRICDVREEQRYALLAYAYLRGRLYKQVERKARIAPDWGRVCRLIEKFGGIKFEKVAGPNQAALDAWVLNGADSPFARPEPVGK